jgi:RNA-binding protein
MKKLRYADIRYLKKLAHGLKPVIQIGKRGLTDSVIESIDRALDDHELIKIKFVDFKEEKREISRAIVERVECIMVGMIGNVVTLYREHPDETMRRISFPMNQQ